MKFTINRNVLLKPLQQVVSVVERNKYLPILSNVLLTVKDNKLTLTCTDLEIEATATIDLTESLWNENGEATVPAKQLLSIIKMIGDVGINFSCNLETLIIPTFDFPSAITTGDKIADFVMASKDLKNLIGKTKHAMAQSDVRFYLNGALLDINAQHMQMVATDGHRMAIAKIASPSIESAQVIIPSKTIKTLHRTLEGIGVTVTIYKNSIRFMTDTLTIKSKIIDGRYPNYGRVIPDKPIGHWAFDKKELLTVLKTMASFPHMDYPSVTIESTGACCIIKALRYEKVITKEKTKKTPEEFNYRRCGEHGQSNIECQWSGDQNRTNDITINVDYLIDVIKTIGGDTVTIDYTSDQDSIKIIDGDQTHVIMPVRP
jgi:DNA polymerase-3 subunit beta